MKLKAFSGTLPGISKKKFMMCKQTPVLRISGTCA
jgi:hypothetical protein